MSRPERNPAQKLIIQQSATEIAELRRNNRLIYGGALADGRAMRGQDGVYTVKVLPPLEVTHLGIALNMHDPMFRINVLGTGSTVPELVVGLPYGVETGGSAGNGPGMAREDHMHAMVLSGVTGTTVDLLGTGATAGAAIIPAREDHVHFHGTPVLNNAATQFYAPTGATSGTPTVYFAASGISETYDGLDHMAIGPGVAKNVPVTDTRSTYPPTGHSFLGATHTDTVAGAPAEGYLVVGNDATPSKWIRFPQGTANQRLGVQADGTGLQWFDQSASENAIQLNADKWVRVTQVGSFTLSTEDWRGRHVWCGAAYYVGTEANARTGAWTGLWMTDGVQSGMQGDNNDANGDTLVFRGGPASYTVAVSVKDSTGHLVLEVDPFDAEIQVRVTARAGTKKTAKDGTI